VLVIAADATSKKSSVFNVRTKILLERNESYFKENQACEELVFGAKKT